MFGRDGISRDADTLHGLVRAALCPAAIPWHSLLAFLFLALHTSESVSSSCGDGPQHFRSIRRPIFSGEWDVGNPCPWRAGIKQRLRDAGIFLAVSLLPIGLWMVRNQWVGGTATNRTIGFHPAGLDQVSDLIDTVGSWFSAFWLSSREIQLLSLSVLAFAGLLIWLLSRTMIARAESAFSERPKAVLFLTTFVVANYLLLLFISISLLDVQIPLDSRILSPCYIPSVLFVVSAVTFLKQREQKSLGSRLIVSVLALSAMGMQLPATLNWLRQLHWQGVGYSSRPWKESETIKRLATLSPSHSIYSNAPDVIYTLLGSPAAMIPRKMNTDSNLPNADYRVQIEQMKRELQTTNGVLVFFDR